MDLSLERLGTFERIVVSALRAVGLTRAIATLRSHRFDRVLFALTPGDPPEFQSVAHLVLALTRARSRAYISLPEGVISAAPKLLLVRSAAVLAWATLLTSSAAAANALLARILLSQSPIRRPVLAEKRLAYLRASFGMPAVGGSVGHTSGVIEAFASHGYAVHAFASSRPPAIPEQTGFTAASLPRSMAYPPELNSHRYSRRFFRAARSGLRADPPAFLYQRYALNDLSGVRLASVVERSLVVEYNGSEVWAQRHWGRPLYLEKLSRQIELACVRHADLVVAVSEPLRQEILATGVPEERVIFYPNCVDTRVFDPERFTETDRANVRRALGVPLDACVLSFVGTFGRWHGAEVLARAIGYLPEGEADRRLHFLFVGEGMTAPEVRSVLSEEIRRGRVTMAGPRPPAEVPGILAASDILVSPHVPNPDGTPFFGSPTKLFEYMAMARPIVASDLDQVGRVLRGWIPGSPEMESAPLAILVRPGDAASLADGILLAVRLEPGESTNLGARARAQVMRAFTWDRHVEVILSRLRELSEG
jgi:glycosyltransferase involved in cell wall biosynthesis